MFRSSFVSFSSALLLISGAFCASGAAESKPSGEQLFGLYCAACHGADGKGAAGAAFPPLVGSEWVGGDARRMIAVILHGLKDPIVVQGKTYNLQMPPQGATLDDEQIASIVNYVRGSWGHEEKPIQQPLVAEVRLANAEREELWTAPGILMGYPLPSLPLHRWGVKNLTARVYEGEWEEMPDFSQLTPLSEEIETGPISLRHAGGLKENFGIVWEGTLESPGDHDSNFFASSVGGLRLYYNDQEVFHLKEQGTDFQHTSARAKASRGENTFRLEYFQKGPLGGLAMQRSGGKMGLHPLTDTDRDSNAKAFPEIWVRPENGKSAIYRNTIKGMSSRAIAIGLEGGVNYGFSASTLSLELAWTGRFINAGQHWTVRGTGAVPPAGEQVVALGKGLGLARLEKSTDPWPSRFAKDWKVRFWGYDLDELNRPTFRYSVGEVMMTDTLTQGQTQGEDGGVALPSLERRLVVEIPEEGASEGLFLRLVHQQELSPNSAGFLVNKALYLKSDQPDRLLQQGRSLILNLTGLSAGQHSFLITYTWNSPS